MKRIVVIIGHPDCHARHYCHALADAYADRAILAGHDVRIIDVGKLDFQLLDSREEWQDGVLTGSLLDAQHDVLWAEHYCFIYPLWMGDMPAKLKGFLEHVLRPGLGEIATVTTKGWDKLLRGRSARIIVTMAMPASVYRMFYRAHTVKSFERNILKFVGVSPVRQTLIGRVHDRTREELQKELDEVARFGGLGR